MPEQKLFNRFVKFDPITKGWSEDKKYCAFTTDGAKYLLRISPISRFETRKSLFAILERVAAVDYMSGVNMGFICFSRADNSITWFAVSEKHRGSGAGAGDRLLKTALRQLDTNKDITVTTFTLRICLKLMRPLL